MILRNWEHQTTLSTHSDTFIQLRAQRTCARTSKKMQAQKFLWLFDYKCITVKCPRRLDSKKTKINWSLIILSLSAAFFKFYFIQNNWKIGLNNFWFFLFREDPLWLAHGSRSWGRLPLRVNNFTSPVLIFWVLR